MEEVGGPTGKVDDESCNRMIMKFGQFSMNWHKQQHDLSHKAYMVPDAFPNLKEGCAVFLLYAGTCLQ